MNKSMIAALAITMASQAYGLYAPPAATKNYCLSVHEANDGGLRAGSCDETKNNAILKKTILKNGCAENQVALGATKYQGAKEFNINISPCLPPNVVQL